MSGSENSYERRVMFAAAQLAARTAGQEAPSWHDLGV
jgi:hypothetical protein